MEQARNDIQKAVIKKDRLNVSFNEVFKAGNYTNNVSKICDQIVHHDLKESFEKLKLHLIVLTEQPEAGQINKSNINDLGYLAVIQNYVVTGYSHDSNDGISGVTIHGQKLLKSGKTVDLKIFVPIMDDDYPFSEDLGLDIQRCDWEVSEYLFSEKWGIKQEMLDFDSEIPEEANVEGEEPKRKGRGRGKRKKETAISAFDETA